MNKFTRIDRMATEPKARTSRVYGQAVSLGEPLELRADEDLRQQVESSLEQIAKEHLIAAENKTRKILDEANAKAQEVLERANAQAKELIRMAQEQEQEIRDTAQESGFKSGFEEGYAEATAQVEQETAQLLGHAKLLVDAAYLAEKKVLQGFETQALGLVRCLVKKILRRELADSPEALLEMMAHASESLYLSGKVRVVVHPQVLHELRQFSGKTTESLNSLQRFEWVTDPALDLHQIYLIGQDQSFELSPDVQVEALTEPLQGALNLPIPEPSQPMVADIQEERFESEDLEVLEPELLPETSDNPDDTEDFIE